MLTVVIETRNDEEALARTLASLVGASIEGVVREVLVHDRGSTDHTSVVADQAGCAMVGDADLSSGLGRARGDWLMLLEPGARLAEGWMEPALHHMCAGTMPARFTRARQGGLPFIGRFFRPSRPFADGLLITRRQALARLKGGHDLAAVGQGLATKRLGAVIYPSPRRR